MIKKHSNDPISQIVDLGDNRYEFCYNQGYEQQENHIDYYADYIVLIMPVDRQNIIDALIARDYTEIEATNLVHL